MADVPCRCTDEDCGHPDGERCGRPITVKLKASMMVGAAEFTRELETGICEECWERVRRKYGFGD
jgi:hypothetical protein